MLAGFAKLQFSKNANWQKGERKGGDVALKLQPKFSPMGIWRTQAASASPCPQGHGSSWPLTPQRPSAAAASQGSPAMRVK